MILAIDVQYKANNGFVCGITFNSWKSQSIQQVYYVIVKNVKEYIPGKFYKRELPCILHLLDSISEPIKTIVIDGYVYLDGKTKMGLGAHLSRCISDDINIVGVAKKPFITLNEGAQIYRGKSKKPLYISCLKDELTLQKTNILSMYGEHRIPILLKKVDSLCREYAQKNE
jgi:deoxyribonuclease V